MDPVKIVMSSGTIEWAPFNLNGYQTFAEKPTDYGALFQWGYDNTLTYQSNTTDGWHTTSYSGSVWNGGQGPCPSGWRLPTLAECNNLINLPANNTNGAGTTSGTWTTYSYTTGASGGFVITPKAGDTTKTLLLPNAGERKPDGTTQNQDAGGYFWSSTPSGTFAYRLAFHSNSPSGDILTEPKLRAYSVRCVRTVE
jgi:uncharacterized protein (TIGR02145 family)